MVSYSSKARLDFAFVFFFFQRLVFVALRKRRFAKFGCMDSASLRLSYTCTKALIMAGTQF